MARNSLVQERIGLLLSPELGHSSLLEWPTGTEVLHAGITERDLRVALFPDNPEDLLIFSACVLARYTSTNRPRLKLLVPVLNAVIVVQGDIPNSMGYLVHPPEGLLQIVRANQEMGKEPTPEGNLCVYDKLPIKTPRKTDTPKE